MFETSLKHILTKNSQSIFIPVRLNEDDNFRSARLLAFSILKVCFDLSDFQVTINFNTFLLHFHDELRRQWENFNFKITNFKSECTEKSSKPWPQFKT